jgi:uroporphyrinogen decarboxylase
MCIRVWDKMAEEVQFDLIGCWEDMAFNGGMLISPTIFRKFMLPNYLKISQFAKEHDIPIILVDSDGFIEDLVPLMQEGGVTSMYPFEVQAGNDIVKIMKNNKNLSAVGCLDKNVMDIGKTAIDKEMEKARKLIRNGRIIPGPDHFPIKSSFENYRYFMEQLKEAVMTETDIQGT